MKKILIHKPAMKIVGISARTNNAAEMNPATAKIGATVQEYFHRGLPEKIQNRASPGTTYCIYTDYENDFQGDYTYFIGEEVCSFNEMPKGLNSLTIPAQNYAQFTAGPGLMPGVCIEAWQKIWQMAPEDLSGPRSYQADFEIYDDRAQDPQNVVLDICIGIK
ncbi:MAG: GyrI-like domain-containing protein [Alphaproteobacteria bacterium]